nr:hypothetical protein [Tanacetum cinerariifolium]
QKGGVSRRRLKGHWKPSEDIKLREFVALHGPKNWNLMSEQLPGRSENDILMAVHAVYGNKWSKIARFLPGRTDNRIKNQWHVLTARRRKNVVTRLCVHVSGDSTINGSTITYPGILTEDSSFSCMNTPISPSVVISAGLPNVIAPRSPPQFIDFLGVGEKKPSDLRPLVAVHRMGRHQNIVFFFTECTILYSQCNLIFFLIFQFGVGVSDDAEAILHSVNRVLSKYHNDRSLAMLTVDFSNAFNLVDRSALLHDVRLLYCTRYYIRSKKVASFFFMLGILMMRQLLEIHKRLPRRPPLGVKLLGGAVSRDAYFISGLVMRRAANAVDLMSLLSQLHDPQSELLLLQSCPNLGGKD